MYSIGDVARLAGVSARVLRHYDEIGLFTPDDIGTNGYRRYGPSQLARLHRILALRDLGFRLDQIGALVADDTDTERLEQMLRVRELELEGELVAIEGRLARVRTSIEAIDRPGGDGMADPTITVKDVAKLHVAELRAISPSFHPVDVGPTISPLYPLLMERLGAAAVRPVGAAIAYYEDDPDGGGVLVHAAVPISDDVRSIEGLDVVDLEPIAQAVCARHRGPMADIVPTVAAMLEWISEHGLRSVGYSREVYLECPPDLADWVTEIQYAVERA